MNCLRDDVEMIRRELLPYMPLGLGRLLSICGRSLLGVEEIRLRLHQPVLIRKAGDDYSLSQQGDLLPLTSGTEEGIPLYVCSTEDIRRSLAAISANSLYAFEEDIRRGYITLPGGHRVGLAGQVVLQQGMVKLMKNFSSMAVRVARQCIGCADNLLPYVYPLGESLPLNTVLLSPPRAGKTTLLRDLARALAQGSAERPAQNVVVVDERSELAGCWQGQPQLELGRCCDVLDACPKAVGMPMALRALSPQVIVTDELGRPEDAAAVDDCLYAGVTVISSVHASDLEDAQRRPVIGDLLAGGAFDLAVVLSRREGPGTIESVWRWCGDAWQEQ